MNLPNDWKSGDPLCLRTESNETRTHKRVENAMKYIGMIHFPDDEYEVATATTIEEIKQLGTAGWTKYDELLINGTQMHFYKKPKKFVK